MAFAATQMKTSNKKKQKGFGNLLKCEVSKMKSGHCSSKDKKNHEHPDHAPLLGRIRLIEGQLQGLKRMIESRRYCIDILTQFRAAHSALRSAEIEVFRSHLQSCVKDAFKSKNNSQIEKKVKELSELIMRGI